MPITVMASNPRYAYYNDMKENPPHEYKGYVGPVYTVMPTDTYGEIVRYLQGLGNKTIRFVFLGVIGGALPVNEVLRLAAMRAK